MLFFIFLLDFNSSLADSLGMKMTIEQQNELERLMAKTITVTIPEFIILFKNDLMDGKIKVIKCEATRCLSMLIRGEALRYVCDVIYKNGMNDDHLQTFYRKLYAKHSQNLATT